MTEYFPSGVFGRTHESLATWFARTLADLGEPSLYALREADRSIVRVLRLPSFDLPTLTRLEWKDGVVERVCGGTLQPRRSLTDAEATRVEAAIAAASIWASPTPNERRGLDGYTHIIEALHGPRYHVLHRWGLLSVPPERDEPLANVVKTIEALR